MPPNDVVDALLQLREQVPALLGERDWHAVEERATACFEELARARTPTEQQAAIDALLRLLMGYRVLATPLRHALRGGTATRGDTIGGGVSKGTTVEVLRRWPHLDVDRAQPVPLGAELRVAVYVDTVAPHAGERSEPLTLPGASELAIQVVLVTSHHFQVRGASSKWIYIRDQEARSTTATFVLHVSTEEGGAGEVTAFLAHGGRPAGSVNRTVTVARGPRAAFSASPGPGPARDPDVAMSVDLAARRPDLTVAVMRVPGTGGRRYRCTVSSPHLPELTAGIEADWDLEERTKDLVLGRMRSFTRSNATNRARQSALIAAGLDFFTAAPMNFQDAYWALRDAGLPLESVYVVSQEPFVPWELMIPRREGQEDALPIGASSAVGRWIHEKHVSPQQAKGIASSYVLAPVYPGRDRLDFAEEEARYVVRTFPGRQITPVRLERIEAELAEHGGADLLHLICHGYEDPHGGPQVIRLDPDELLDDGMLEGIPPLKRAVAHARPLVFLNACEVGRLTPALVGTGGFASRFIALGASAVVAPIWSVKDEVAAQVARTFYEAVRAHPRRPFAAVLRDIRRRAYETPDAEDSWAAYCFYGDPLTALTG